MILLEMLENGIEQQKHEIEKEFDKIIETPKNVYFILRVINNPEKMINFIKQQGIPSPYYLYKYGRELFKEYIYPLYLENAKRYYQKDQISDEELLFYIDHNTDAHNSKSIILSLTDPEMLSNIQNKNLISVSLKDSVMLKNKIKLLKNNQISNIKYSDIPKYKTLNILNIQKDNNKFLTDPEKMITDIFYIILKNQVIQPNNILDVKYYE